MSIITLPLTLTNPDPRVPMVRNYSVILAALASMHSWHSMRAEFLQLDELGNIQQVADRSGKGRLFTQGTVAQRPAFVPNRLNGHGVAQFSAHALNYNGPFPTAAYTKFILHYVPAETTRPSMTLFGHQTSGNINHRVYLEPLADGSRIRHQVQNQGASLNPGAANTGIGKWNLAIASFDGATGSVRVSANNGPIAKAENVALTQIQDLPIFLGYGSVPSGVPTSTFEGFVADVIVANVDLRLPENAAEMRVYLDYYRDVYGIPV